MKKEYILICESNENLKKNIDRLKELGYNFIVKAQDKILSGWGYAEDKKHIHLIACRTYNELYKIKSDLYNDNSMCYVNWTFISNYKSIYSWTRNKSFTVRNDWTRAFYSEKEKELYEVGE